MQRAKFGINGAEIVGQLGNVRNSVGAASLGDMKVWDFAGMHCHRSVDLPKLDVDIFKLNSRII
jgi:hypothetical protein